MNKHLSSVFLTLLFLGVPLYITSIEVFAQSVDGPVEVTPNTQTTTVEQDTGSFDIQPYKTLVRLPGIPEVVDPSIADGGAGTFTLPSYIRTLVRIAIGIIGILAVVMIVISGIQYMGSDMITEKEDARSRLKGAVLGLLLAVSSVMILRTINPQLVNIRIGSERFQQGVDLENVDSISIPQDVKFGDGNGYLKQSGNYTGGNPNVTSNITTYDTQLKAAATEFGVSCTVLKAHAYAESGMNPNAQSPAGAKGLIQLMPATFNEQNVGTNPFNPAQNTRAAAKFMSKIVKNPCPSNNKAVSCIGGDYNIYTTAAYNTGTGGNKASVNCPGKAAWQCEINPGELVETQKYVPRVHANIQILQTNGWGCD